MLARPTSTSALFLRVLRQAFYGEISSFPGI
jgi:hypothetical protein